MVGLYKVLKLKFDRVHLKLSIWFVLLPLQSNWQDHHYNDDDSKDDYDDGDHDYDDDGDDDDDDVMMLVKLEKCFEEVEELLRLNF